MTHAEAEQKALYPWLQCLGPRSASIFQRVDTRKANECPS